MIFVVPTSTDAPIYHWPWVTLSLIVLNLVAFVLTGFGYDENAPQWQHWALEFGGGLNPLEWVSCHFLHFGMIHLVGNMIFLWGFGLVVEGKIGWWRYLLVYFGIGMAGAALVQLMMLGAAEASVAGGASLIIFGLLGMCVVWAPKNEVTCMFFFFYRAWMFDVTILTFCVYYIGFEVLMFVVRGLGMSSQLLHLVGASLGFGLGVLMLKRELVDCENWDLFAVWKGTYGSREDLDWLPGGEGGRLAPTVTRAENAGSGIPEGGLDADTLPLDLEESVQRQEQQQRKTLRKMHQFLKAGKPRAALQEFQRLKHVIPGWQLDAPDLHALADGLYKINAFSDAVPLIEEFVTRFPAKSTEMRLKLAGVAIEVQNRPRYALKLLEDIPEETLTDRLAKYYRRMHRVAQKMIDDGVIELEGQSW